MNRTQFDASDAINQFYDKTVSAAHDRFKGQENHLRALRKYSHDIRQMKRGALNQTVMTGSPAARTDLPMLIKYPLDKQGEMRRLSVAKHH